MLRVVHRVLGALLGLALTVPVQAAGSWWNADWQYRKEVTFDLSPTGADIAGTAQDVPVLIRLSLANFNYFNDAKPDGSDFRLLDGDDKTPLKFHFERYDQTNQMAFLWVHVPRLTGGAKTDKIYAYYGNKSAPAGGPDQPGTYDVATTLVLHFGEASGPPQDATAYKNNASAATAEAVPASLIAGGIKAAGGTSVTVPATASLRLLPNQGFTASAWVKFDQAGSRANVVTLADGAKSLTLGVDGSHAFASLAGGAAPVTVTQTADLAAATWHHLAVTAGGGSLTLYVDGAPAGNAPVQLVEIGGTLTIAGAAGSAGAFTGEIDEVQAAKVARAAEWVKAAAKAQGPEAPLVVYGADGQKEGGGGTSYFGTIIKNLTVDSWVVIVICIVMLVVSIIIMILKAFFLSGVEKGNRSFLAEYHRSSGDGAALEKSVAASGAGGATGGYGTSTLYRVFHVGAAEIAKRVHGTNSKGGSRAALSAQAIEAIRASMDATSVREGQRLSAQMVMLTIAISGGPFLGLLGTVIGVMITFAAIAASGDVNVNAIAPGVSAALAATVAGLAVAIPCLFGYNWLNTRIKSINADTRVFVDEFVARIAEQYS